MPKAEALRQAQVTLITGDFTAVGGSPGPSLLLGSVYLDWQWAVRIGIGIGADGALSTWDLHLGSPLGISAWDQCAEPTLGRVINYNQNPCGISPATPAPTNRLGAVTFDAWAMGD